jgi:hypothetical protein
MNPFPRQLWSAHTGAGRKDVFDIVGLLDGSGAAGLKDETWDVYH